MGLPAGRSSELAPITREGDFFCRGLAGLYLQAPTAAHRRPQRRTGAHSGTQAHAGAHSGTQAHAGAHSGTQAPTAARRRPQRHAGARILNAIDSQYQFSIILYIFKYIVI